MMCTFLLAGSFLLLAPPVEAPAQPATYAQARKLTDQTGRPLVVVVGADWCPACRRIKRDAVPELVQRGVLDRVSFAMVNTDRQSKLARKLMKGGAIPQIIMYRKDVEGWHRHSIVGARTPDEIESFIRLGLSAGGTASR